MRRALLALPILGGLGCSACGLHADSTRPDAVASTAVPPSAAAPANPATSRVGTQATFPPASFSLVATTEYALDVWPLEDSVLVTEQRRDQVGVFRIAGSNCTVVPALSEGLPKFGTINLNQEPDHLFPIRRCRREVVCPCENPGARWIQAIGGTYPGHLWLIAHRGYPKDEVPYDPWDSCGASALGLAYDPKVFQEARLHPRRVPSPLSASDLYRFDGKRWTRTQGSKIGTVWLSATSFGSPDILVLERTVQPQSNYARFSFRLRGLGTSATSQQLSTEFSGSDRALAFDSVHADQDGSLLVLARTNTNALVLERWATGDKVPKVQRFDDVPFDDSRTTSEIEVVNSRELRVRIAPDRRHILRFTAEHGWQQSSSAEPFPVDPLREKFSSRQSAFVLVPGGFGSNVVFDKQNGAYVIGRANKHIALYSDRAMTQRCETGGMAGP